MKPNKVVELKFGKKEKGLGERAAFTDKRRDDMRYKGKHPACRNCSGCGKGNPCPVI